MADDLLLKVKDKLFALNRAKFTAKPSTSSLSPVQLYNALSGDHYTASQEKEKEKVILLDRKDNNPVGGPLSIDIVFIDKDPFYIDLDPIHNPGLRTNPETVANIFVALAKAYTEASVTPRPLIPNLKYTNTAGKPADLPKEAQDILFEYNPNNPEHHHALIEILRIAKLIRAESSSDRLASLIRNAKKENPLLKTLAEGTSAEEIILAIDSLTNPSPSPSPSKPAATATQVILTTDDFKYEFKLEDLPTSYTPVNCLYYFEQAAVFGKSLSARLEAAELAHKIANRAVLTTGDLKNLHGFLYRNAKTINEDSYRIAREMIISLNAAGSLGDLTQVRGISQKSLEKLKAVKETTDSYSSESVISTGLQSGAFFSSALVTTREDLSLHLKNATNFQAIGPTEGIRAIQADLLKLLRENPEILRLFETKSIADARGQLREYLLKNQDTLVHKYRNLYTAIPNYTISSEHSMTLVEEGYKGGLLSNIGSDKTLKSILEILKISDGDQEWTELKTRAEAGIRAASSESPRTKEETATLNKALQSELSVLIQRRIQQLYLQKNSGSKSAILNFKKLQDLISQTHGFRIEDEAFIYEAMTTNSLDRQLRFLMNNVFEHLRQQSAVRVVP